MTENEKAATFIGWSDQSGDKAPSMGSPANFVKAFKTLRRQGGGYSMADYYEKHGPGPQCRVARNAETGPWGDGAVPRQALAALYDAEHPEDKP